MFFLCLHGENSVITRVSSRLLSHEVAFLIIGESQNAGNTAGGQMMDHFTAVWEVMTRVE